MSLRATFFKKTFTFAFKARTSRGPMSEKTSWFIRLWDENKPDIVGIGEAGPLPGLSPDAVPDFEVILTEILSAIPAYSSFNSQSIHELVPENFPSIRFAIETAWLDLKNGGKRVIFNNDFVAGTKIPINGLIWMGDLDFMMHQINEKIQAGFTCIKLKVGGLDFDRECDVLDYIRKRHFKVDLELRLDANGAFKVDDALYKLNELAKFRVQSIEQPIKPGLPQMEELCRKSPIPIALDEELIGVSGKDKKTTLLTTLRPQFIILKPTLVGGIEATAEWIQFAEQNNIGWWITSALESSIGLNAICQLTANYAIKIPQGLGTGAIYTKNIRSPLEVKNGQIGYNSLASWEELS